MSYGTVLKIISTLMAVFSSSFWRVFIFIGLYNWTLSTQRLFQMSCQEGWIICSKGFHLRREIFSFILAFQMRMAVSVSCVFEIWNCNNIKKEILYTSIKLPRITYAGVQLGFSYLAVWIHWTTSNRSQQRLERDMLYQAFTHWNVPFHPSRTLKRSPLRHPFLNTQIKLLFIS